MCGICGFFHRDAGREVSDAVLARMTDRMAHRGPDERGVLVGRGGALGHRRLTILDLIGGQQPMALSELGPALVSNGEIYNYLELKNQHLGDAALQSSGDTEVLLRLLTRLGRAALPLLNGMFAFGFWDREAKRLLLARDPVGQKPLFYYHGEDCFAFASELSSLAALPGLPFEIDADSLAHYLLFESFPHPHTPLRGVRKLEPGHFLELDLQRWSLRRERYWDETLAENPELRSDAEQVSHFGEAFRGAVDRHLRSDVDVGVFLSAGLDSPSLVKAAAEVRGGANVKTFTIRHELPSFDESGPARRVSETYGTQHHERLLRSSDFLEDVHELLRHVDEPVADPGMLAIYQVVKFSREHVKVVLSGNGGDEFYAGYAPFRALPTYRLAHALLPGSIVPALQRLAALPRASHEYMNLWLRLQRFLRGVAAPPAELLMRWIGAFDDAEARAVLHPERVASCLEERSPETGAPRLYDALYREHARVAGREPVDQLLHMFQSFFLPVSICNHSDKASMKQSQELRSPFLDAELMRFANRLPADAKLRSGETKWLLRRYLEPDLRETISGRPKQGFTIPIAAWLTSSLKDWANEVLDPQQLQSDRLFDATRVRQLWDEHQSRRANHAKALWTVIVFQYWLHTTYRNWRSA